MTHKLFVFVLMVVSVFALASKAKAEERTIVIPEDNTPFTVSEDAVVRLTGEGIAGAKIKAEVDGPAKIIVENALRWVAKGHNKIGSGNKEFEVKPTGKGKITVTITSTSPIPNQKPTITKYEFEVKK
jgi:hypothetical protein